MSKYQPLALHLAARREDDVHMSFSAIERVIGQPLPASARRHRPWWSNNPGNNEMTQIWLSAGFRTERVDMAYQRLVFRRMPKHR